MQLSRGWKGWIIGAGGGGGGSGKYNSVWTVGLFGFLTTVHKKDVSSGSTGVFSQALVFYPEDQRRICLRFIDATCLNRLFMLCCYNIASGALLIEINVTYV